MRLRRLARLSIPERYAYVALVALSLLLTGASIVYSAHQTSASNRQWCDTLALLTSKPVPKPSDPAANPSRMQAYTLYADFVTLRHRLGC